MPRNAEGRDEFADLPIGGDEDPGDRSDFIEHAVEPDQHGETLPPRKDNRDLFDRSEINDRDPFPKDAKRTRDAETDEANGATGKNQTLEKLEKRMRHFQGQFTREQQARKQAEEGLQALLPLRELIQGDTELQAIIKQRVERQGMPEAPRAPERPSDYDQTKAFSDPTSSSWKYQRDLEAYRDARDDYREKQINVQNDRLSRQLEAEKRARQAERWEQERLGELETEHGFDKRTAKKFMEVMSSPETTEFGNLVKLFKLMEKASGRTNETDDDPNEDRRYVPGPRGGAPRTGSQRFQTSPQLDKEFNKMIAGWKTKRS